MSYYIALQEFYDSYSYNLSFLNVRQDEEELKRSLHHNKVHIFWEGQKILQDLHPTFVFM